MNFQVEVPSSHSHPRKNSISNWYEGKYARTPGPMVLCPTHLRGDWAGLIADYNIDANQGKHCPQDL